MCKPCVGAKLVLRFQALIAHAFLNRSISCLYHKPACTSGSICRKRIPFISKFGAIVSHFVRGDLFLLTLYSFGMKAIWYESKNTIKCIFAECLYLTALTKSHHNATFSWDADENQES